MAIVEKVEEFLRRMGYTDEIPSSLPKICGPSTAFIWEQIFSRFRPRQEISLVRNNLILNQMSTTQQNKFDQSVDEIDAHLEKQKLRKHVDYLEKATVEKERIIDELMLKNNTAYLETNNLKSTIKETKLQIFLVEQKCQNISQEIGKAKKALTLLINITPETEKVGNLEEINKTLLKCSTLLQTNLQETVSSRKPSGLLSSLYLNTPKCSKSKAFCNMMNSSGMTYNKSPLVEHSSRKNHTPKRESLGLLPSSYLEATDELDMFLFSGSELDSSDSILENTCQELIVQLRKQKSLNGVLQKLLHCNNRVLAMYYLKQNFEGFTKDIRTSVLGYNQQNRLSDSNNETFACELRFVHVKNELKNDKLKITLKKLKEVLKQKKDGAVFQFNSRLKHKDREYQIFELRIEEVCLIAANHFLKQELEFYTFYKKQENIEKIQLVNTRMQIRKLQEEILSEADLIFNFTNGVQKLLQSIKGNREETLLSVKKIFPYVTNTSWTEILKGSANYEESHAYAQFHHKNNKKLLYGKFNKENSNRLITSSYIEMNTRNMQVFMDLISTPFAPLQILILNFLTRQFVTDTLRRLQIPNLNVFTPSFCLENAKNSKSTVESVYCKLDVVLASSAVRKTSSYQIFLKEMFELWTEKSFVTYISDRREINGHNFNYYESQVKSTLAK